MRASDTIIRPINAPTKASFSSSERLVYASRRPSVIRSRGVFGVVHARISISAWRISELLMSVVTIDCPHCGSKAEMRVIGASAFKASETKSPDADRVALGVVCPGCHYPVAVLANRTGGYGDHTNVRFRENVKQVVAHVGPIDLLNMVKSDHWPKAPKPNIPEHLPDAVSKAYLQAEKNYVLPGHEEAAGMMYRRSLELALNLKYPDIDKSLAKTIKELVETNVLTADIGAWATDVRLIGNAAAHAEVTREDLDMMRGFADAVLKYVWTLPTQVAQRRGEPTPPVSGGATVEE